MSRINETLRRWNGREVASLTRLVTAGPPRPGEVNALIDLVAVGSARERTGATWLLLAWARCGEQLSVSQTTRLVGLLPRLTGWLAVLHCCQLFSHLGWPPRHRHALDQFVARALTSPRPFVRAWAWDGWAALHKDDPDLVERLEAAAAEETASVRARIRALLRAVDRTDATWRS